MAAGLMTCEQKHQEQEPADPTKPGGLCAGEGFGALEGPPGLWVVWAAARRATFQAPLACCQPGAPTQSRGPCSHWGRGPSTFHHDPES